MKKKIILCTAFVLCVLATNAFGLEKHSSYTKYEDEKNGYSGWVASHYQGTLKETNAPREMQNLNQFAMMSGWRTSTCTKVSKEDLFLLWSALERYDYKKGEVYYIAICYDLSTAIRKDLNLFVEITGKNTINWVGFYTYQLILQ